MYRNYNANPLNNNVTDCFIRSLSCATGKSWDYVFNEISNMAQWNGTTMDDRNFILEYLDRHFERLPKFYGTIGEASKMYRNNTILVTTKGHIVCCKQGNVLDSWDSSNRPVEYIWLVKKG